MTKTTPALDVDWSRAEDLPVLQRLVDAHWRKGHVLARDPGLFRWQYRVPGDSRHLSVLVARMRGEPVGFLGVIRTPFCNRGEIVSGGWLAMWFVTPEARSTQAGLALVLQALREFDVIGCLGFNETAEAILRRLSFHVKPRLPRFVTESMEGSPGKVIEWSDGSAEAWERRWRDEIAANFVGTARDAAFLRWRYVEHPTYRYIVRFAEDASAVVVHRVETAPGREAPVVRFVEAVGDPREAARLVGHALAENQGAWLADFTCVTPHHAEPFLRAGFTSDSALREPPPDRFQPLERSRRGLWAAFSGIEDTAVYATRADGDQDRPS